MTKTLAKRLSVVILLVVGLGAGWAVVRLYRAPARAEELLQRQDFVDCRSLLGKYLWLFPNDDAACLTMAKAYVWDQALTAEQACEKAFRYLRRIPDDSPLAPDARMKEARLRLMVLHQPHRAERLFRQALKLEPDAVGCYYLLWKLYDLTVRSDQAEPFFWKTYELASVNRRATLLREWYMSQFFPAVANPEMDRKLGFLDEGEAPSADVEIERLLRFRRTEPSNPTALAGVARWYSRNGDPQYALTLLEQTQGIEAPFEDGFYVSTLIEVLYDLGEFQRALQVFGRWPEPHDGYEYWKWRAVLHDEVHHDYEEAIRAYRTALSDWPGEVDWQTQFRLAHCLTRAGNHEAAREMRKDAKKIELLMEQDVHNRLQRALGDLQNAEQLKQLVEFYRNIGRPREADCWAEQIDRLQASAVASTP